MEAWLDEALRFSYKSSRQSTVVFLYLFKENEKGQARRWKSQRKSIGEAIGFLWFSFWKSQTFGKSLVLRRPGQNRVTWKTSSSRAFVPLQEPVAVLASYVPHTQMSV
jgi:hypothetical protein